MRTPTTHPGLLGAQAGGGCCCCRPGMHLGLCSWWDVGQDSTGRGAASSKALLLKLLIVLLKLLLMLEVCGGCGAEEG